MQGEGPLADLPCLFLPLQGPCLLEGPDSGDPLQGAFVKADGHGHRLQEGGAGHGKDGQGHHHFKEGKTPGDISARIQMTVEHPNIFKLIPAGEKTRGPRREGGFTLAEVLVALAIFALMGSFLFAFVVRLEEQGKRLDALGRQTAQLQAFWDRLRRDLEGRVRVSFAGLRGGFMGEEGELSLILHRGYRVTYRLEGERLIRRRIPLGRPSGDQRVMVEGVKAWRLRYLEKGRWLSRWIRRQGTPEAVRFELVMDDGTWHSAFRL